MGVLRTLIMKEPFLDINDTYEERKEKLHIIDMEMNPKRHLFTKDCYTRHEFLDKCTRCFNNVKHEFIINIQFDCYQRIK
jgi:hypothetical protein